MAEYLIYFNQDWVGDHTAEWFSERGRLARAVIDEMKAAGVYVFAGGLDEDAQAFSADATTGRLVLTDGPFVETKELLAGYVIISSDSLNEACQWAVPYLNAVGASEVDVLELE